MYEVEDLSWQACQQLTIDELWLDCKCGRCRRQRQSGFIVCDRLSLEPSSLVESQLTWIAMSRVSHHSHGFKAHHPVSEWLIQAEWKLHEISLVIESIPFDFVGESLDCDSIELIARPVTERCVVYWFWHIDRVEIDLSVFTLLYVFFLDISVLIPPHPFIVLMNAGDSHIVEAEQQTTELRMPDKLAIGG